MDMLLEQVAVLPIEHSLMVEVDAMPTGNVSEGTSPPPSPKFTPELTNPPPSPK